MDAPPPPPPPGSPPPADGKSTTIGKYIARFRQESPRPRDARATAPRADFWWLEKSKASPSPGGREQQPSPRDDDARSSSGRRSAMEWELELLSDASEADDASASATTRSRRGDDSVASSSAAASPSWQREIMHTDPQSMTVSARPSGWRGEDDAVVVDDGFVVLHPVDDTQLDEREMLAASLEDPEMVIQRIRRRLGFQPPAPTTSVPAASGAMYAPEEPPSFSFSPLLDGEMHDGYLQQSFDRNEDASSQNRTPLVLDLSMSLEDMRLYEDSSHTPISVRSTTLGSPAPPEQKEEAITMMEETTQQESTIEEIRDAKREEEEEKEEADLAGVADQGNAPGTLVTSDDESEKDTGAEQDIVDEEKAPETSALGEPKATESLEDKSSQSSQDPSLPPQSTAPTLDARAKQLPSVEEKRSPRLPPLSPARGPVFKPAPVTPRALDVADPPEITAETSKTLDSLLSFVVHSWGENSFFGSDDGGDHASVDGDNSVRSEQEGKTASSPIKDTDPLMPPVTTTLDQEDDAVEQEEEKAADRQAQEDAQTRATGEGEHAEDDDPAAFAADPVVVMLRERIGLFEEALHRLDAI